MQSIIKSTPLLQTVFVCALSWLKILSDRECVCVCQMPDWIESVDSTECPKNASSSGKLTTAKLMYKLKHSTAPKMCQERKKIPPFWNWTQSFARCFSPIFLSLSRVESIWNVVFGPVEHVHSLFQSISHTILEHKHKSAVIWRKVLRGRSNVCKCNLESVVFKLQFCYCCRFCFHLWLESTCTVCSLGNNSRKKLQSIYHEKKVRDIFFSNDLFFIWYRSVCQMISVRYLHCSPAKREYSLFYLKLLDSNHWTNTQTQKMKNLHRWINMRKSCIETDLMHYLID